VSAFHARRMANNLGEGNSESGLCGIGLCPTKSRETAAARGRKPKMRIEGEARTETTPQANDPKRKTPDRRLCAFADVARASRERDRARAGTQGDPAPRESAGQSFYGASKDNLPGEFAFGRFEAPGNAAEKKGVPGAGKASPSETGCSASDLGGAERSVSLRDFAEARSRDEFAANEKATGSCVEPIGPGFAANNLESSSLVGPLANAPSAGAAVVGTSGSLGNNTRFQEMLLAGNGREGLARFQIERGALAGGSMTVRVDGRRVSVSMQDVDSAQETSLRSRLAARLAKRGFEFDEET
jgi:hypothetical protein